MEDRIKYACAKLEEGFPARFIASRTGIDYRELFKLEKNMKKRDNRDFSGFCAWLMENETEEFKTKFKNMKNKMDYKMLSIAVVPQNWFIAIYIFLKHKESKDNKIWELLETFSISEPTWRRYKNEILKLI